ncbi:MAG TPA: hypothetical protein VLY24_30970 [Bryobacteraceae bacterium]|nr:hypothetical protein [Bryobacteraceae bacterium]
MTIARPTRAWVFVALALSINIIDPQLARMVSKPQVSWAAAFDLAVVVPALYFWLVVRSGIQPIATMLPLCLLALFRATWVLPGSSMMRPLLGAGVEVAAIALVITRTRRSLRQTQGGDVLERIEAVLLTFVRLPQVAAIAAGEVVVLYYAFATWRRKPEAPAGMQAFSIHERSGTASLFGVFAAISAIEVPLLHLMVMRWNSTAAWVLSAMGAYGGIWMLGMSRALVLRPVLVGNGELLIRSGILWTVRVPLERIASIHQGGGSWGRRSVLVVCGASQTAETRRSALLRLCPGSDPNLGIEFSEPVTAAGMFGIRRRVTRVALAADDPIGLERAVNANR